ncbi:hypothetical protein SDC9_184202 [bioreactor metagenome]|uniref:Uncharacterized protein n=1 Tax=bioreactor metagenome TaxID=1076179 RepID=A0A645HEA3_9ZZZZ
MGVAQAFGLAQAHSVDDRGVVEFVADDGILFGQQWFEQGSVGIEARGKQDGVIHP